MIRDNALRSFGHLLENVYVVVIYGVVIGFTYGLELISRCWAPISWLTSGIIVGHLMTQMFRSSWVWQPLALLIWAIISIGALHRSSPAKHTFPWSISKAKDRAHALATAQFLVGVIAFQVYASWLKIAQ